MSSVEFRGFVVRRRQSEDRRHRAAVKIQTQIRGYQQRVTYRRQRAEHCRQMTLLTSGTYRVNPFNGRAVNRLYFTIRV